MSAPSRSSQNVVVGAVILVALFLLVFGMAFLNESVPGGVRDEYYVLETTEVGLLAEDDPVKLNGVRKGKVASIALVGNRVHVGIALEAGYRIPHGSNVQIQNVGLMGERMINIALDTTSGAPVHLPGDTLSAGYDAGIAETMGAAARLIGDAHLLLGQLQMVVDSTVGREDFPDRVNAMVDRLDRVSLELDRAVTDMVPQVSGAVKDLTFAAGMTRDLAQRHGPRADTLAVLASRLGDEAAVLMADLRQVSAQARVVADRVTEGRGTAGRLLADDDLHQRLEATLVRTDSLLQRIRSRGLDVNIDFW